MSFDDNLVVVAFDFVTFKVCVDSLGWFGAQTQCRKGWLVQIWGQCFSWRRKAIVDWLNVRSSLAPHISKWIPQCDMQCGRCWVITDLITAELLDFLKLLPREDRILPKRVCGVYSYWVLCVGTGKIFRRICWTWPIEENKLVQKSSACLQLILGDIM